jgi:SAM-dependent methyltransferase
MNVDRRFDAYQQFVLDCKKFWSTQIYPELRSEFDRKCEQASTQAQTKPQSITEVAELLGNDTLYHFYAWYERHLQRMKYSGRHGLVPHHEQARAELEARLAAADSLPNLTLSASPTKPDWYTAFDVHQHPGGVWGDSLAGIIYERGARSTTPLAERHGDLHDRFTTLVQEQAKPQRLIDLGCGFGKSTRPFYKTDPNLEIVAIDLSAPCLRLAALTAHGDGARSVQFVEGDAAHTGMKGGSFDTVTSTMLLHEVPPAHLDLIFAESCRLLAPGGIAIHLDFWLPKQDAFGRFIHFGHGRRNNEPFMEPLCHMDLVAAHRRAGFSDVQVLTFEEAPGALSPEHGAWRFPWAVVIARK